MGRPYKRCERDRIERMVKAAELALHPDLEHLSYALRDDHHGDPAIFLRMVISDRLAYQMMISDRRDSLTRTGVAKSLKRLRDMEAAIRAIVEPEEYGLNYYYECRSLQECRKRTDADWPAPIEGEVANAR